VSKYTTEVRFICEDAAGYDESKGFNDIDEVLTKAAPKVFNFDWPIFDENYRLPLEKKILRHNYTREICEETVGLWKLRLQDTLCNIMPYYNKLYESELIKFNPMYDVDMTTTHRGSSDTVNELNRDETESGKRGLDRIEGYESGRDYDVKDSGSSNINKENSEDTVNSNVVNENRSGSVKESGSRGEIRDIVESENRDLREKEDREGTQDTNRKENSTDTTNGTVGHNEWNLYSDTPQGGLTGIERANDTVGDVAENAYLTNARHIYGTDNTTDNVTATVSNVDNNTISADSIDRVNSGTVDRTTDGNISGFNENERVDSGVNARNEDNVGSRSGEEKVSEINSNSRVGSDNESKEGFVEENVVNNGVRNTNENGIVSNMAEYEEHIIGKRSYMTYSKMLQEFRETFLNIDMMILDDLKPCFFNLW
jgi:hypothetical protein